jgi:glutathione S-transferase
MMLDALDWVEWTKAHEVILLVFIVVGIYQTVIWLIRFFYWLGQATVVRWRERRRRQDEEIAQSLARIATLLEQMNRGGV